MAGTVTINLLQDLHRPLVRKAPLVKNYPTGPIGNADLPLAITVPGEAESFDMGGGYKEEIRQYTIYVFVEATGQDTIPKRIAETAELLKAFSDTYCDRRNAALQNPTAGNGGYQITITTSNENRQSDTGLVSDLAIGAQAYNGFRRNVEVREKWPIST